MKLTKTKLSLAVLSALTYTAHAEELETSKTIAIHWVGSVDCARIYTSY